MLPGNEPTGRARIPRIPNKEYSPSGLRDPPDLEVSGIPRTCSGPGDAGPGESPVRALEVRTWRKSAEESFDGSHSE